MVRFILPNMSLSTVLRPNLPFISTSFPSKLLKRTTLIPAYTNRFHTWSRRRECSMQGNIRSNLVSFQHRSISYKASELLPRLMQGHRPSLAKAITLVESKRYQDLQEAQNLMKDLPVRENTIRIGISGPPGVGKSSFIETFGMYLIEQGLRVAVLAVDPSSTRTGGSILGDKTRMDRLSKSPNAYIRPSPSAGFLGGVTANAYEAIAVCEAAGYDVIIVETVGVGQSETQVADLCDLVMLLVNPGGGDALQGIKRGIVEIADLIVVNKADGDLLPTARKTRVEYMNALRLMSGHWDKRLWFPEVLLCSTLQHNDKIENIWKTMQNYKAIMSKGGDWKQKRQEQRRKWMWRQVMEEVLVRMYYREGAGQFMDDIHQRLDAGEIQPRTAVDQILQYFHEGYRQEHEKAQQGEGGVNGA